MLLPQILVLAIFFLYKFNNVSGKVYIHRTAGGGGPSVGATAQASIIYHNGYLMTGNVNIHNIYIGNIATQTMSVLDYFANNIGNTDWYKVMTLFYQSINNQVTYVTGTTSLSNALMTRKFARTGALTETIITQTINSYLTTNNLSPDPNAMYAVVFDGSLTYTAPDGSTWLGTWCGYHNSYLATDGKTNIKFFVTGDPSLAAGGGQGCNYQGSTPPNNSPGGDGAASVYAHELIESVTDWDGNGWYFANGNENGDQCGWVFGTYLPAGYQGSSLAANSANVVVGSKYYLIQETFVPQTRVSSTTWSGVCALSGPTTAASVVPSVKSTISPSTSLRASTAAPSATPSFKPVAPSVSPTVSPRSSSLPTSKASVTPTTLAPSYSAPTAVPLSTASPSPLKTAAPSINLSKPLASPTLSPSVRVPVSSSAVPTAVLVVTTAKPTSKKTAVPSPAPTAEAPQGAPTRRRARPTHNPTTTYYYYYPTVM